MLKSKPEREAWQCPYCPTTDDALNPDSPMYCPNCGELVEYVTGGPARDKLVHVQEDGNHIADPMTNRGSYKPISAEPSKSPVGRGRSQHGRIKDGSRSRGRAGRTGTVGEKPTHPNLQ